jgi:hypothetical protein
LLANPYFCSSKFRQVRFIRQILQFYITGFREMKLGKTLWLIILIKLFIMFVVLKLFFFPNFLKSRFDTDEERASYVIDRLTNQP